MADQLDLLAYSLLAAWLAIAMPGLVRGRAPFTKVVTAAIALLAARFAPVHESCSLADVLFGAFGELSATTSILLGYFMYAEIARKGALYRVNPVVFVVLLTLAAILYLSVLGYIGTDIYAWGYHPSGMLLLYLAVQAVFFRASRLFALLWLLGLMAFVFGVQRSLNLWDYLFDPLWVVVSIAYLVVHALRRLWVRAEATLALAPRLYGISGRVTRRLRAACGCPVADSST